MVLVEDGLATRVLVDAGLARVLIDVSFTKVTGRCQPCKRVLVVDGFASASDPQW